MTDTDSIIDQLASEGALPKGSPIARFVGPLLAALALGCIGVALVADGAFASMAVHGVGPIAMKWGFSIALMLLAAALLLVLGKPGRPHRVALAAIAIPFVPVVALFAFEMSIIGLAADGATWRSCLAAMVIVSPIAFAFAIAAVRSLAPVQLDRAGMAAGLFGGAVAMTAYAPFCPELGMGYMVVFYIIPILVMAAIGWLTGPKLLRW